MISRLKKALKQQQKQLFAAFLTLVILLGLLPYSTTVAQTTTTGCDLKNTAGKIQDFQKNTVGKTEKFKAGAKYLPLPAELDACKAKSGEFQFEFSVGITVGPSKSVYVFKRNFPAQEITDSAGKFTGLGVMVETSLVDFIGENFDGAGVVRQTKDEVLADLANPIQLQFRLKSKVVNSGLAVDYVRTQINLDTNSNTHNDTGGSEIPSVNTGAGESATSKNFEPKNLKITVGTDANKNGLRKEYYYVNGESGLKVSANLSWAVTDFPLASRGDTISRDGVIFKNAFEGIYAGINYDGIVPDQATCKNSAGISNRCDGGVAYGTSVKDPVYCTNQNNYYANPPFVCNSNFYTDALTRGVQEPANITAGQPYATKGFTIFPIISINNGWDVPMTTSVAKFSVLFFKTKEDREQYLATKGVKTDPNNPQQADGSDPNQLQNVTSGSTDSGKSVGGGDVLFGLINKIVASIIGLINEILFFVFFFILAPLIEAILSIHTYTDAFSNVIYPGWEVVRNISNIFLILALVAIALGTLFRLKDYNYKNLLVKLILAALLVNFSLVISQGILGIADTVQNQFLPNNLEVVRTLGRRLMVEDTRATLTSLDFSPQSTEANVTVKLFVDFALGVGAFFAFGLMAVFLLVRMVALWMILMLSPLAFVANVLPSTKKFHAMFWDNLFKWGFFTPVFAFFLNLTAVIANQKDDFWKSLTSQAFQSSVNSDISEFMFKTASHFLLLAFLLIGLKFASGLKLGGLEKLAGKVEGYTRKPWTAPGVNQGLNYVNNKKNEKLVDLAQQPGRAGKVGRTLFPALAPLTYGKAVGAQLKENKKKSEEKALQYAAKTNFLAKTPKTGDKHIREREEKEPVLNGNQAIEDTLKIAKSGATDKISQERFELNLMKAAEFGDLGKVLAKSGKTVNAAGLNAYITEMEASGLIDKSRSAYVRNKLGDVAAKSGDIQFQGGTKRDPQTGLETIIRGTQNADGSFTGSTSDDITAWKNQQDVLNKKLTKKGLNWLARDASSAILIDETEKTSLGGNGGVEVPVKDKITGTVTNKKLPAHVTQDGRKLIQNSDKIRELSEASKQKFVSILANKGTLEALESDLASDYQKTQAEAGYTVSDADAYAEATKQIQDFGFKLLERDVYSSTAVSEIQQDPLKYVKQAEPTVFVGGVPTVVRASEILNQIKAGKGDVEAWVKTQFKNTAEAKLEIEPNIATSIAGTKHSVKGADAVAAIEDSMHITYSKNLAERFEPKDLGVNLEVEQMKTLKEATQKAVLQGINDAMLGTPPPKTLKEAQRYIDTSLGSLVGTVLPSSSGGPSVTISVTELIELKKKVLAGLT